MTEKDIQRVIWARTSHLFTMPNTCVLGHEADVIGITRAGYIHEYEIKISVSDFYADQKKHKSGNPNFFWYVVPEGLVGSEVVPEKAGLIYIVRSMLKVVKRAPRLHKIKITEKQKDQMLWNLCGRYWRLKYYPNEIEINGDGTAVRKEVKYLGL